MTTNISFETDAWKAKTKPEEKNLASETASSLGHKFLAGSKNSTDLPPKNKTCLQTQKNPGLLGILLFINLYTNTVNCKHFIYAWTSIFVIIQALDCTA